MSVIVDFNISENKSQNSKKSFFHNWLGFGVIEMIPPYTHFTHSSIVNVPPLSVPFSQHPLCLDVSVISIYTQGCLAEQF